MHLPTFSDVLPSHANQYIAFTLDTYFHIIEGIQPDGVALLDEVLPVPVDACCIGHTNLASRNCYYAKITTDIAIVGR
jgi:hypothetical protein